MARPCTACAHPRIASLNRDLVAGVTNAEVARRYGLKPDAIRRHADNHLDEEQRREITLALRTERAQAVADALNEGDVEIHRSLKRVVTEIDSLLQRAKADGNDPLALMSLREMRNALMDLAKLTGTLQNELTVNVNLNESPQFIVLRQMILRVLDRHPDAKADFLGEMQRLQIGHG
ncbi:hypothetical protein [Erythrobacter sp.]|uniref:hypothetical protein n=1 Tax=Erythrobacter sp. TaxID=1042 RepID=UPI001425CD9D|nr:hypothetical protein [Erythrobacter sp.]QIQ87961.1 MAG: hypothetical protein G9473_15610 [Erythrobacter sp.]